jgi:hypothetical protein
VSNGRGEIFGARIFEQKNCQKKNSLMTILYRTQRRAMAKLLQRSFPPKNLKFVNSIKMETNAQVPEGSFLTWVYICRRQLCA